MDELASEARVLVRRCECLLGDTSPFRNDKFGGVRVDSDVRSSRVRCLPTSAQHPRRQGGQVRLGRPSAIVPGSEPQFCEMSSSFAASPVRESSLARSYEALGVEIHSLNDGSDDDGSVVEPLPEPVLSNRPPRRGKRGSLEKPPSMDRSDRVICESSSLSVVRFVDETHRAASGA